MPEIYVFLALLFSSKFLSTTIIIVTGIVINMIIIAPVGTVIVMGCCLCLDNSDNKQSDGNVMAGTDGAHCWCFSPLSIRSVGSAFH